MTGKERYDNIEIPARLSDVIQQAQQRGRLEKRRRNVLRRTSISAACAAAIMITVNVPNVAMALSDVPVIGSIVKVLQIGSGGQRTDNVSITTTVEENQLNINFTLNGEQTSTAPAYTVDYKTAPNRLIFSFYGVRNLDYEKLEKDIRALSNVKDVYNNIILDDSAFRFVVELKENIDYSVSEYQQPGYIQLKLFGAKAAERPHEVYYVRSQAMEQGESIAILEEQYSADDSSIIKTKEGKFILAMGGFKTQEEADALLKQLSTREDYSEPLHVDHWMNNARPE